MPLYTYRCAHCGRDTDKYARMAERETSGPDCCGAQAMPIMTATMIQVPGGIDIDYQCPMTGEHVQSMRRRKYLMESNGVVDARAYKDTFERTKKARVHQKQEAEAQIAAIPDDVKRAFAATGPV